MDKPIKIFTAVLNREFDCISILLDKIQQFNKTLDSILTHQKLLILHLSKFEGQDSGSLVGLTVPYCSAGNGSVCQGGSKTWTAARIYLYESVMQSSGFTTERRKVAVAHEFGHALSLQHVLTSTVASLIKVTLPATSTVENIDKANLRAKWGD